MSRARFLAVAIAVVGALPISAAAARPAGFVPERYALSLATGRGRSFGGRETIDGSLAVPTRQIALDSLELRIAEARVHAGAETLVAAVSDGESPGTIVLTLPRAVAGAVAVELVWSGTLADDLSGLFATGAGSRRALFTDFEPTEARRVFPCIDRPDVKARFAVSADIDARDEAVSNGRVVEREALPGERARVRFAETPPLPTYLVALAVGRFGALSTTVGDTPLRVLASPDDLPLAHFALDSAAAILPRLERYFARPYPFAKLDLVSVPAFAPGGMENAGAIFLRDDRLLVDAAHASPSTIHAVTLLIAHELAHQWLGDLATPAAWNDLWLAEATATYVANEVVAELHPEWQPWDELQPAIDEVMSEDQLLSTHPVRATDAGQAVFDAVVYTKGAALLRMLAGSVGAERVRDGLRRLVAAGAFENVSADDLWAALDSDSDGDEPVAATARGWFEERGVPVVDVAATPCRDGVTTVSLRRAHPLPAWTVPVALRWAGGRRTVPLGDAATVELDGCPAWIDANAGRLGFYRVRYAPPLAAALAAVAATALDPAERIGLLSDAWLDVRDGAPLGSYLTLAGGLRGERSPVVLDELGRRLAFIDAQLVGPAERGSFERFVDELLSPTLAALGWSARPGDSDGTRLARGRAIALLGGVARAPAVLAAADRRVRDYLADPATVDGALADALAPLGAQTGDSARYHAYLARLRLARAPEERDRLREALAHFEQPALRERALALLLTGAIPADALMRFAARLADNPRTRTLTWRFFERHFDALERKAPRAGWLLPATQRLCDDGAARTVGSLLAAHEPYAGLARAFAETTERIVRCATLRQRTTAELAGWLHARYAEALAKTTRFSSGSRRRMVK